VSLEQVVINMEELTAGLGDAADLLDMAAEEGDADTADAVAADLQGFEQRVGELEFRRMFSGEMDAARRPRTGPRCSCACICAGPSSTASRPS
jgi:peptide chain release factor 2